MTELAAVSDGSTKIIKIDFLDEAGSAMTPITITWSLYDELGAVVNSRSAVSVTAASSIYIVTSGADNYFTDDVPNRKSMRYLTIKSTYTGTYGTALPLNDCFSWEVTNCLGV